MIMRNQDDPCVNAGISLPLSVLQKLRAVYPDGVSAALREYLVALADGKLVEIKDPDDHA